MVGSDMLQPFLREFRKANLCPCLRAKAKEWGLREVPRGAGFIPPKPFCWKISEAGESAFKAAFHHLLQRQSNSIFFLLI